MLLALCGSALVVGHMFILQHEDNDIFLRFIAIAGIIFFGGGGLLCIIVLAWKPIVVISSEGITVPYGWGKNFVPWENVEKFEVVEQVVNAGRGGFVRQKYIGIFVFDKEGIVGVGKVSQAIAQKITGLVNVPALSINLSFSFVKIEKVMGILQEFYDNYNYEGISITN